MTMDELETRLGMLEAAVRAMAKASGHHGVVDDVMSAESDEMPAESAPDYVATVAKAESLGIKVDKRWGMDRLLQEIDSAEAEHASG
jgi:hypothetical protein